MQYIAVILIGAAAFGVFWLIDKGFTKLFRSQAQHMSGLAIRLNKRYCSFGLILSVLGIASMLASTKEGWIMLAAGGIILLVGVGLIVYYMTFGVFYDDQGFVYTTFGRKSTTYMYKDIKGQMLYNSSDNTIIELHMSDGKTVHLSASLENTYGFMDKAFACWLQQTGRKQEDCDFYDPDNSCWFPTMGG